MILGIGCDLVEIARIKKAIDRHGSPFLHRIFSLNELSYARSHKDPAIILSGRFAAKEALSKALGTGIGKALSWHDMEILNDEKGKPFVLWNEKTSLTHKIQKTHLSISHTDSLAIAYAILES